MRKLKNVFVTFISAIALTFGISSANAQDTIVLGSAISLTGKYATNGEHTQRGYDLAVKLINDKGGVKVGGKKYNVSPVKYYDDESNASKAAALAQRLIEQDGVKYMLGPTVQVLRSQLLQLQKIWSTNG